MSAVVSFDDLPAVNSARLPASYEAAKNALAECSRVDECQAWADKAEAIASYAKQAKDETLRKYADRIQARAIRRCGELLKQIEPAKNQHDVESRAHVGTVTSRSQAASDAGLSERQKVTALRVASIPAEDFDYAVESQDPPTITELARQGTKSRLVDLGDIPPADYARATEAQGTLRRFAEYCERNPPDRIARAFKPHEISQLRSYVGIVDTWLDRFITQLPE